MINEKRTIDEIEDWVDDLNDFWRWWNETHPTEDDALVRHRETVEGSVLIMGVR